MQILNKNEQILLSRLLKTRESRLKDFLRERLKKKYVNIINNDKYIIAQGDIPVLLIAHMDTVFTDPPKDIFYDKNKNIVWSGEGLGADDRAGIYSILKIIEKGYLPHIIFTTDEEKGCLGAKQLVKDIPEAPFKINFAIELDRRGEKDSVYYDCDNLDFENYINDFGFVTNFGSFSDISEICSTWGMAGVNLSIGYLNEHSIRETLNVSHMLSTIEKVCTILDNCKLNEIKYDYIPIKYLNYKYNVYGNYENYNFCAGCFECKDNFDLIPVQLGKITKYYCIDCFIKIFKTCPDCEQIYINDGGELCPTCRHKK